MKISWIIPTVNQYNLLFNGCIDSFTKHHGKDHEIIVIDDGSQPVVQEQIQGECQRRNIKCILNQKNSGFSTTVNKGIRASTGDIVVLVNNDIVFTQPIEKQIQDAFERHPRIGVVGSLLFYPHGTIQHAGIITPDGCSFTHRGWHKTLDQAPEVLNPGYFFAVTGALFSIKRTMLDEIGLLNENFFIAFEDTEMCLRAWKNDWRVFYDPKIQAIHAEGATRGRVDSDKQTKYRQWYLKELETLGKFRVEIKKYDLNRIFGAVSRCNAELTRLPSSPDVEAERIVFGGSSPVMLADDSPKIAVRRLGAIGDVLFTTGVIRQIKIKNPKHKIIVSTAFPDVFRGNPNVETVVRSLDGVKVEKVYDLDLVYENNPKMPIWEAYARSVFGNCDFDVRPEMFSGDGDLLSVKQKLAGAVDLNLDSVIVVHMSTSWPSRMWPQESWNEVTKALSGCGYKVVVVGSGKDFRSEMFYNVYNMHEKFNILEIRELCKRAKAFVGMDSGMLHIAQTTEIPIVGLFTVANPKYRIFNRANKTVALVPKLECRFCLHEQKPPVTFVSCKYGSNHCLHDITPNDVIQTIKDIARS